MATAGYAAFAFSLVSDYVVTPAEGETTLAAQAVAEAGDPKEQAEAQSQEQALLENAQERSTPERRQGWRLEDIREFVTRSL